jgi:hypothetical protein
MAPLEGTALRASAELALAHWRVASFVIAGEGDEGTRPSAGRARPAPVEANDDAGGEASSPRAEH